MWRSSLKGTTWSCETQFNTTSVWQKVLEKSRRYFTKWASKNGVMLTDGDIIMLMCFHQVLCGLRALWQVRFILWTNGSWSIESGDAPDRPFTDRTPYVFHTSEGLRRTLNLMRDASWRCWLHMDLWLCKSGFIHQTVSKLLTHCGWIC